MTEVLTIHAPAKINLTLEVLGKRPDGYHEIRSILQTINLCDTLNFESSQELVFKSSAPDWDAEKSLVSHAARLLQETTGCKKGATITVEKLTPLISGLGGDSSDAAATLIGLNQLWELCLSQKKLLELANQLGSDVAFFLYGGTALAEGRGERIIPLPPLPHRWAILVIPEMPRLPGKTAQLYASLKSSHYTDGHITQRLLEEIKEGREPTVFFNTFENVAFTRGAKLTTYRSHLLKMGIKEVHLAGSGPALFTLLKDKTEAEDLYTRCINQGMETYLVETE